MALNFPTNFETGYMQCRNDYTPFLKNRTQHVLQAVPIQGTLLIPMYALLQIIGPNLHITIGNIHVIIEDIIIT